MNQVWMQLNRWRDGDRVKQMLATGRAYLYLSLFSMLLFVTLGVADKMHEQTSASPVHSMQGIAATVPVHLFGQMLETELPGFKTGPESHEWNGKDAGLLLLRALTGINPGNPSSLLAGELPGMQTGQSFLIRRGVATDVTAGPQDHTPFFGPFDPIPEASPPATGGDGGSVPPVATAETEPEHTSEPSAASRKVAFIYHSHSRESWFPELDKDAKDPSSGTVNITLVGKRLADKLEEKGIGAMHSDTDYPTAIKDYRWELSYKYSMKTVKEALASSESLKLFFDLHRDSQKRKYTTVDIDGTSYAQVYFVIGHKNPDWKKNEAFAAKIHEALEEKYPGISRGIWGKTAATGNGEYNQSLAEQSVLIEVGGIENTLEESYRTADALAEIIADIYWDAEKVSGERVQ